MSPRARLALGAGIAALIVGAGIVSCPRAPVRLPTTPDAARAPRLRRQAMETWTQLDEIVRPCDAAVAKAERASPPLSDPQASSGPARDAQALCRAASLRLVTLEPPAELDAAARGGVGRALERCQFVYAVEGNSHARLAAALEAAKASTKPDKRALFEAWAETQEANIDARGCRIGFVAAARSAGLPINLFKARADAPANGAFHA